LLQETLPEGTAQLNAIMYFDGIQQDEQGFEVVDGGIVQGAFFRKEAREQNEAMRSVCTFIEVRLQCVCVCVC
jgi:hypothetical protein